MMLLSDKERICPVCQKKVSYSTKYNALQADERGNTCRRCAMKKTQAKFSAELWKNAIYAEKVKSSCKEGSKKFWESAANRERMSTHLSKRNLENWQKPEYRKKMYEILKKTKGKYSGHYKGHHFRSSLELFFIMTTLSEKDWESCENGKFAIPYSHNGKMRVYYPDFRYEKFVIEIKPRFQFGDPVVQLKAAAAKKWCEKRGLVYKLLDPGKFSGIEMKQMHDEGIISLDRLSPEYS
jgi:hypothetical protein